MNEAPDNVFFIIGFVEFSIQFTYHLASFCFVAEQCLSVVLCIIILYIRLLLNLITGISNKMLSQIFGSQLLSSRPIPIKSKLHRKKQKIN